jgi:Flp pilus assembly protein CpaB
LRRSSRLVLLLGAFLAVLTFVVVLLLSSNGGGGPSAQPTPPSELPTVVASADIPLGTVVTSDMVESKKLAVASRDADSLGDVSQAIGKIARKPIAAGAQVHVADFATSQAQVAVPAGKRAFALEVNEKTGVGNLIFPGDYVDVVLTLGYTAGPTPQVQIPVTSVPDPENITGKVPFLGVAGLNTLTVKAPVLLQEIQVLGTIEAPIAPTQGTQGSQTPATPQPAVPTLTDNKKLIILAVTDAQAEALIFARATACGVPVLDADCSAALDLVLRSPEDKGTTETTTGVVLKLLLDTYGVLPPYVTTEVNAFVPAQP